ncbi:MAG: MiaB/RimO family radical SAM methylthiotransferase [Synergistaceae bacterium]|nr:MiaB/RimO family radical SAM methylthiotransferase [Synergistaceae bacterium]
MLCRCEMNILSGKRFTIHIQGCRTNQYEGEAIAAALEAEGAVRGEGSPDIVIIVSCTITAVADRKCRKLVRRARRENPRAVVALCGCYVQKMTDAEMELLEIDIAVGNRLKYRLPRLIAERLNGAAPLSAVERGIETDASWDGLRLDRPRLHTRAFLKVQDGCNHYCSYCIVPLVRGRPVSRPLEEAVEEARRVTESGCPEIVLTGVHLGLYEELPLLVRRIGALPLLRRLRFGSIEPFAVNEELLAALAETPSFCEHLHMPLQSGDDGVLAAMRRGYDSAAFAKIAERARARLGDSLHISTDLMTAFPCEDAAAFKRSLKFVEELGFGKLHVFPYSPREGTEAARMKRLPDSAARERTAEALELAERLHRKFCSRWIGDEVTILAEEKKNGVARGLTRNYIRVTAQAEAKINEELRLIPTAYRDGGLTTEGLEAESSFDVDISVI